MLVPVERVELATIEKAKPDHLLLSFGSETTLFWIVENNGDRIAMFLSGAYAGQGFRISDGSPWPGILVGPVELRVDIISAHDGRYSESRLRAANDELAVSVRLDAGGFMEPAWIAVAKRPTIENRTVYFTRWSLGSNFDGEWCELVKFDGDNPVSGTLVPTPGTSVADLG